MPIYTKGYLAENNIVTTEVELMYGEVIKTVKIPKNFILMERVKSKCSLAVGDVIQNIMMCVFNVKNPLTWYNENSSGGLTIPCKPSMTDTHHVYEFRIKLRQNSSEKMEALL